MKDEDKTKRQLLTELKTLRSRLGGVERVKARHKREQEVLRKRTYQLSERLKELNCLCGISRLADREGVSSNELFQGIVELIPPAWQYPKVTCAQIILGDLIFRTTNFKETIWRQKCDICRQGERMGTLEVCYLKERPQADEGPFLREERTLIEIIAERFGEIVEQMQTQEALYSLQRQLRSLVCELSSTQERERRHLARELHDSVGHALALCKIKLGALRELLSPRVRTEYLEEIYGLLEEAIRSTRSLTFELSPPLLHEMGLEPALEWLAERVQRQSATLISFESEGQLGRMDGDAEILLFQTARELLVNVVKHARARNARISICRDHDDVQISVEDDGVGFETPRLVSNWHAIRGLGLFNLRERLNHAQGHLEIQSEPGHGTRVTIVLPLKLEKEIRKIP